MVSYLCLCGCNFGVFIKKNTERKDVVQSSVYSRYAFDITRDNLSILPNDDVGLTNSNLTKECNCMKKNKGIAILLFAILLQMCSSGMELLTLAVGAVGLVVAIIDDRKKD